MTLEHRIELLKLTKPNFDMPDIEAWIARAKQLEAYVTPRVDHDADTAMARELADALQAKAYYETETSGVIATPATKRFRAPKV